MSIVGVTEVISMIARNVINLSEYGPAKIYTGRDNGMRARAHFHLEEIEDADQEFIIVVKVPNTISALNSSFLLGFLDRSIQRFGSKERFLRHFQFDMDKKFLPQLDETIKRALFRQTNPNALSL